MKNLWSNEHFTRENENSTILPILKLPPPLGNYYENFFTDRIDKIDKIIRGFQNCHNLEGIFCIPDFPLKTLYIY